jgi:carbon monoxide dehydrogenase subunit G
MPEQKGSIEIDASRGDVWTVISNPSRLGDWTTIHRGFEGEAPSEVEEGTTFTQELEVAGQTFSVEWTAEEVEAPDRMVWKGKGPAGTSAESTYELAEADGGTEFTYSIEFDPPGGKLGEAAAKPVAAESEEEASQSLERLKRLLEA